MELGNKGVKLKLDRNPRPVFPNAGPVHGTPLWNQLPSNQLPSKLKSCGSLVAESLGNISGIF